MYLVRFRSFLTRRQISIAGLSLVLSGALLALYVAHHTGVLPNRSSVVVHENAAEIDGVLLCVILVATALLIFSAKRNLSHRREIVKRIAAERRVRKLAYHDGLTGLPNRRQYEEALAAAIASPPCADAAHGVFLLDLNGFKQVNDVHGHEVGDQVLVVVGKRLRAAMRDGHMVARFGGDEFAILATHLTGSEAATSIALRVVEALAAPIDTDGTLHQVGVGIGIVLMPSDANTSQEALRRADIALYRAKAERNSTLRFFESAMDFRVRDRATKERSLH